MKQKQIIILCGILLLIFQSMVIMLPRWATLTSDEPDVYIGLWQKCISKSGKKASSSSSDDSSSPKRCFDLDADIWTGKKNLKLKGVMTARVLAVGSAIACLTALLLVGLGQTDVLNRYVPSGLLVLSGVLAFTASVVYINQVQKNTNFILTKTTAKTGVCNYLMIVYGVVAVGMGSALAANLL